MNPYQIKALEKAQADYNVAMLALNGGYYAQAISQAYYAMFHCALAILETKQLNFSKHSAVIASFGKEFAKTGLIESRFHRYLIEAEDDRLKADYDIISIMTVEVANLHLERAQLFIEMTTTFLGSAT